MAKFKGDHEIHTSTCTHLPAPSNREFLGQFMDCSEAIKEAKELYSKVNGCYYCCRMCHNS